MSFLKVVCAQRLFGWFAAITLLFKSLKHGKLWRSRVLPFDTFYAKFFDCWFEFRKIFCVSFPDTFLKTTSWIATTPFSCKEHLYGEFSRRHFPSQSFRTVDMHDFDLLFVRNFFKFKLRKFDNLISAELSFWLWFP